MSYLQNINPNRALETLGLRREESSVLAEVILPGLGLFVLGACVGEADGYGAAHGVTVHRLGLRPALALVSQ